ncbi:MAG: hypothetical protein KAS32_16320 [Candidatus Peribacteraceae bacterium]|nr:hypothetical protein [Candidatus Peribacteraceae bacterium]
MELQQQVCSLEISKRLKELGVNQESLWYWKKGNFVSDGKVKMDTYGLICPAKVIRDNLGKELISAFTVAELGELLPAGYFGNKSEEGTYLPAKADILTKTFKTVSNSMITNDWTMANVYGCILIYLLENKLI